MYAYIADSLPFFGHGDNMMIIGCWFWPALWMFGMSWSYSFPEPERTCRGHVLPLRFFSEAPKPGAPISTTAVVFPKESDTAEPWIFT